MVRKYFTGIVMALLALVMVVGCDTTAKEGTPVPKQETTTVKVTPPEKASEKSKLPTTPSPTAKKNDQCVHTTAGWFTEAKDTGILMAGMDELSNVRIGRHECFDRIVFDVDTADRVGFRAQYVPVAKNGATGNDVSVAGSAVLDVTVDAWAKKYALGLGGPDGAITNNDGIIFDSTDWKALRQVRFVMTYEGHTQFAVGVDSESPFEIYHLPREDGKMRVVIDIKH